MPMKTTDRLLEFVYETAPRNEPAAVIDAIDRYSRNAAGMIHLGCDKGRIFDRIVRQSGALRVLELGTNYGYSALRLALNLDPGATIDTVELSRELADTAEALMKYSGIGERITVRCGKAADVVKGLCGSFDLIFVDHLPENYYTDLLSLEESGQICEGTIVVSDNVVMFERQLEAYLKHLRQGGGYKSDLHLPSPGADGIEVSVRLGVQP